MLCEICGERKAVTTIEIDGVELRVCSNCAKLGRKVPRKEKVSMPRKRITEKEELDIMPDFAEKIRRAREKMGLSREELAKKINEKESLIEKIESGKRLPDLKLARKLEKFLGIRIVGKVSGGEVVRKALPPATLGDIAEVRVKN